MDEVEKGTFTLNHCCTDTIDALLASESEVHQALVRLSQRQDPHKNKEYILDVANGKSVTFDTRQKLAMFEKLYLCDGYGYAMEIIEITETELVHQARHTLWSSYCGGVLCNAAYCDWTPKEQSVPTITQLSDASFTRGRSHYQDHRR